MKTDILDTRKNRWWALFPLLALVWHSYNTAYHLHPHYLLFVCYWANLFLGIGMIIDSQIFVGAGAGWTLVGFPLWLYNVILTSDLTPSSLAFHTSGLVCGALAVKDYRFPRYTWSAGLGLALVLHIMSRYLTEESLNVNAAFRVYLGWENVFPSYHVYLAAMALGFGAYFRLLTWANNRFFFSGPTPCGGNPPQQGTPGSRLSR
jgi:hypothetical protein